MKPKVITGFIRLSDDEFNTFAQHIIDSITGNKNYLTPTPTLAAITTARTEFNTALAAMRNGGKGNTVVKNQKRATLEELLGALSLYIQMNCKNDMGILLSSGFNARKESDPVGILLKPENFKVQIGPNSGSIKLSVNKITGANAYIYKWALTPITEQTAWETEVSSSTVTIKNLTLGKEYAFKVAGKGAADEVVYSDIITHYVA